MKNKLALFALSCGLCFTASAQTTEEEVLKPAAGDKTLEVSLYFDGGTTGQTKLRKFTTENVAFRYGAVVGYDYRKLDDNGSSSDLLLSFVPGVEKHFAGTKRLSPYIGLTVPLSFRSQKYDDDHVEIVGGSSNFIHDRSYWGAGLNGIAGVDFYVVKNFFIGFEVGVGADYRKYHDVETYHNDVLMEDETVTGHGAFSFGTFTSGGLRIGFAF